jgi:hypothetical protein
MIKVPIASSTVFEHNEPILFMVAVQDRTKPGPKGSITAPALLRLVQLGVCIIYGKTNKKKRRPSGFAALN